MDPAKRQKLIDDRVPSCETGPAGRILFVIREISQAVSRHRIRTAKVGNRAAVAAALTGTGTTENKGKNNFS